MSEDPSDVATLSRIELRAFSARSADVQVYKFVRPQYSPFVTDHGTYGVPAEYASIPRTTPTRHSARVSSSVEQRLDPGYYSEQVFAESSCSLIKSTRVQLATHTNAWN